MSKKEYISFAPQVVFPSPLVPRTFPMIQTYVFSGSRQGLRRTMEDCHGYGVLDEELFPHIHYYYVFDGHGGKRAAEYARDHICRHITSHLADGCVKLHDEEAYIEAQFARRNRAKAAPSGEPSNNEASTPTSVSAHVPTDGCSPCPTSASRRSTLSMCSCKGPCPASSDPTATQQSALLLGYYSDAKQLRPHTRASWVLRRDILRTEMAHAAVRAAFISLDQEIMEPTGHGYVDESGATAVIVLLDVLHASILSANVGDARAVLCRGKAAVPLSQVHAPYHPVELVRIQANGAWVHNNRLQGSLAISRALGDAHLKRALVRRVYGNAAASQSYCRTSSAAWGRVEGSGAWSAGVARGDTAGGCNADETSTVNTSAPAITVTTTATTTNSATAAIAAETVVVAAGGPVSHGDDVSPGGANIARDVCGVDEGGETRNEGEASDWVRVYVDGEVRWVYARKENISTSTNTSADARAGSSSSEPQLDYSSTVASTSMSACVPITVPVHVPASSTSAPTSVASTPALGLTPVSVTVPRSRLPHNNANLMSGLRTDTPQSGKITKNGNSDVNTPFFLNPCPTYGTDTRGSDTSAHIRSSSASFPPSSSATSIFSPVPVLTRDMSPHLDAGNPKSLNFPNSGFRDPHRGFIGDLRVQQQARARDAAQTRESHSKENSETNSGGKSRKDVKVSVSDYGTDSKNSGNGSGGGIGLSGTGDGPHVVTRGSSNGHLARDVRVQRAPNGAQHGPNAQHPLQRVPSGEHQTLAGKQHALHASERMLSGTPQVLTSGQRTHGLQQPPNGACAARTPSGKEVARTPVSKDGDRAPVSKEGGRVRSAHGHARPYPHHPTAHQQSHPRQHHQDQDLHPYPQAQRPNAHNPTHTATHANIHTPTAHTNTNTFTSPTNAKLSSGQTKSGNSHSRKMSPPDSGVPRTRSSPPPEAIRSMEFALTLQEVGELPLLPITPINSAGRNFSIRDFRKDYNNLDSDSKHPKAHAIPGLLTREQINNMKGLPPAQQPPWTVGSSGTHNFPENGSRPRFSTGAPRQEGPMAIRENNNGNSVASSDNPKHVSSSHPSVAPRGTHGPHGPSHKPHIGNYFDISRISTSNGELASTPMPVYRHEGSRGDGRAPPPPPPPACPQSVPEGDAEGRAYRHCGDVKQGSDRNENKAKDKDRERERARERGSRKHGSDMATQGHSGATGHSSPSTSSPLASPPALPVVSPPSPLRSPSPSHSSLPLSSDTHPYTADPTSLPCSAIPFTLSSAVSGSAGDKFLVIACDGLFDVMSQQDVVNFVLERFRSVHVSGLVKRQQLPVYASEHHDFVVKAWEEQARETSEFLRVQYRREKTQMQSANSGNCSSGSGQRNEGEDDPLLMEAHDEDDDEDGDECDDEEEEENHDTVWATRAIKQSTSSSVACNETVVSDPLRTSSSLTSSLPSAPQSSATAPSPARLHASCSTSPLPSSPPPSSSIASTPASSPFPLLKSTASTSTGPSRPRAPPAPLIAPFFTRHFPLLPTRPHEASLPHHLSPWLACLRNKRLSSSLAFHYDIAMRKLIELVNIAQAPHPLLPARPLPHHFSSFTLPQRYCCPSAPWKLVRVPRGSRSYHSWTRMALATQHRNPLGDAGCFRRNCLWSHQHRVYAAKADYADILEGAPVTKGMYRRHALFKTLLARAHAKRPEKKRSALFERSHAVRVTIPTLISTTTPSNTLTSTPAHTTRTHARTVTHTTTDKGVYIPHHHAITPSHAHTDTFTSTNMFNTSGETPTSPSTPRTPAQSHAHARPHIHSRCGSHVSVAPRLSPVREVECACSCHSHSRLTNINTTTSISTGSSDPTLATTTAGAGSAARAPSSAVDAIDTGVSIGTSATAGCHVCYEHHHHPTPPTATEPADPCLGHTSPPHSPPPQGPFHQRHPHQCVSPRHASADASSHVSWLSPPPSTSACSHLCCSEGTLTPNAASLHSPLYSSRHCSSSCFSANTDTNLSANTSTANAAAAAAAAALLSPTSPPLCSFLSFCPQPPPALLPHHALYAQLYETAGSFPPHAVAPRVDKEQIGLLSRVLAAHLSVLVGLRYYDIALLPQATHALRYVLAVVDYVNSYHHHVQTHMQQETNAHAQRLAQAQVQSCRGTQCQQHQSHCHGHCCHLHQQQPQQQHQDLYDMHEAKSQEVDVNKPGKKRRKVFFPDSVIQERNFPDYYIPEQASPLSPTSLPAFSSFSYVHSTSLSTFPHSLCALLASLPNTIFDTLTKAANATSPRYSSPLPSYIPVGLPTSAPLPPLLPPHTCPVCFGALHTQTHVQSASYVSPPMAPLQLGSSRTPSHPYADVHSYVDTPHPSVSTSQHMDHLHDDSAGARASTCASTNTMNRTDLCEGIDTGINMAGNVGTSMGASFALLPLPPHTPRSPLVLSNLFSGPQATWGDITPILTPFTPATTMFPPTTPSSAAADASHHSSSSDHAFSSHPSSSSSSSPSTRHPTTYSQSSLLGLPVIRGLRCNMSSAGSVVHQYTSQTKPAHNIISHHMPSQGKPSLGSPVESDQCMPLYNASASADTLTSHLSQSLLMPACLPATPSTNTTISATHTTTTNADTSIDTNADADTNTAHTGTSINADTTTTFTPQSTTINAYTATTSSLLHSSVFTSATQCRCAPLDIANLHPVWTSGPPCIAEGQFLNKKVDFQLFASQIIMKKFKKRRNRRNLALHSSLSETLPSSQRPHTSLPTSNSSHPPPVSSAAPRRTLSSLAESLPPLLAHTALAMTANQLPRAHPRIIEAYLAAALHVRTPSAGALKALAATVASIVPLCSISSVIMSENISVPLIVQVVTTPLKTHNSHTAHSSHMSSCAAPVVSYPIPVATTAPVSASMPTATTIGTTIANTAGIYASTEAQTTPTVHPPHCQDSGSLVDTVNTAIAACITSGIHTRTDIQIAEADAEVVDTMITDETTTSPALTINTNTNVNIHTGTSVRTATALPPITAPSLCITPSPTARTPIASSRLPPFSPALATRHSSASSASFAASYASSSSSYSSSSALFPHTPRRITVKSVRNSITIRLLLSPRAPAPSLASPLFIFHARVDTPIPADGAPHIWFLPIVWNASVSIPPLSLVLRVLPREEDSNTNAASAHTTPTTNKNSDATVTSPAPASEAVDAYAFTHATPSTSHVSAHPLPPPPSIAALPPPQLAIDVPSSSDAYPTPHSSSLLTSTSAAAPASALGTISTPPRAASVSVRDTTFGSSSLSIATSPLTTTAASPSTATTERDLLLSHDIITPITSPGLPTPPLQLTRELSLDGVLHDHELVSPATSMTSTSTINTNTITTTATTGSTGAMTVDDVFTEYVGKERAHAYEKATTLSQAFSEELRGQIFESSTIARSADTSYSSVFIGTPSTCSRSIVADIKVGNAGDVASMMDSNGDCLVSLVYEGLYDQESIEQERCEGLSSGAATAGLVAAEPIRIHCQDQTENKAEENEEKEGPNIDETANDEENCVDTGTDGDVFHALGSTIAGKMQIPDTMCAISAVDDHLPPAYVGTVTDTEDAHTHTGGTIDSAAKTTTHVTSDALNRVAATGGLVGSTGTSIIAHHALATDCHTDINANTVDSTSVDIRAATHDSRKAAADGVTPDTPSPLVSHLTLCTNGGSTLTRPNPSQHTQQHSEHSAQTYPQYPAKAQAQPSTPSHTHTTTSLPVTSLAVATPPSPVYSLYSAQSSPFSPDPDFPHNGQQSPASTPTPTAAVPAARSLHTAQSSSHTAQSSWHMAPRSLHRAQVEGFCATFSPPSCTSTSALSSRPSTPLLPSSSHPTIDPSLSSQPYTASSFSPETTAPTPIMSTNASPPTHTASTLACATTTIAAPTSASSSYLRDPLRSPSTSTISPLTAPAATVVPCTSPLLVETGARPSSGETPSTSVSHSTAPPLLPRSRASASVVPLPVDTDAHTCTRTHTHMHAHTPALPPPARSEFTTPTHVIEDDGGILIPFEVEKISPDTSTDSNGRADAATNSSTLEGPQTSQQAVLIAPQEEMIGFETPIDDVPRTGEPSSFNTAVSPMAILSSPEPLELPDPVETHGRIAELAMSTYPQGHSRQGLDRIADELCLEAIRRGSSDNVTCLIVMLRFPLVRDRLWATDHSDGDSDTDED